MQCSIRKIIQLTDPYISLDLTIPGIRIELAEPLAEDGELLRRESANLVFEPFDLAHSGLRKTATEIIAQQELPTNNAVGSRTTSCTLASGCTPRRTEI
jgi:hypothetical protein